MYGSPGAVGKNVNHILGVKVVEVFAAERYNFFRFGLVFFVLCRQPESYPYVFAPIARYDYIQTHRAKGKRKFTDGLAA